MADRRLLLLLLAAGLAGCGDQTRQETERGERVAAKMERAAQDRSREADADARLQAEEQSRARSSRERRDAAPAEQISPVDR